MTPADRLLEHFDRLAGTEPKFVRVSPAGIEPLICVAIYFGFPIEGALTAFTMGLSHFHPPEGSHKELMISMLGADESWAVACGTVASQLYDRSTFNCGDTINFRERIAPLSEMTAFVAVHPLDLPVADQIVDIGVREVELMQLVPIYEQERAWFYAGGDPARFFAKCDSSELMDPSREPFDTSRNALSPGAQLELKTIEYRGGLVRFRIPSDWVEEYEPEGGGTFYDEAVDSTTLRLNVITAQSPEPVNASTAERAIRDAATSDEREVVALGNGNAMASYRLTNIEDGSEIAIYRWEVAHAAPPMFVHVAIFSLTVLLSKVDAADVADLIKLVACEAASCDIADIAAVSSLRVQLPERRESVLLAAMDACEQGMEAVQLACTTLEAPSAVAVAREMLGDNFTVMVGEVKQPDPRLPRRDVPFVLWSYEGSDGGLTTEASPALPSSPEDAGAILGKIASCPYSLDSWSRQAFDAARRLAGLSESQILATMLHPPPPIGMAAADWRSRIQVAAALVVSHMASSSDTDSHAQLALHALLDGPIDWTTTASIIALLDVARRDKTARVHIVDHLEEVIDWEVTPITYSCAIEPAMLAILDIPDVSETTRRNVFARLCAEFDSRDEPVDLPSDNLGPAPLEFPTLDAQVHVQTFDSQLDMFSSQSIVMAPTLERPIGLPDESSPRLPKHRLPSSWAIARTLLLVVFLAYVGLSLFGDIQEYEQHGERLTMNALLMTVYDVFGKGGAVACYTLLALFATAVSLFTPSRKPPRRTVP